MRGALIVSAVLHITLLAALLVTLPDAESYASPPVSALPVELVTIEDVTDLTAGDVEATEVVEDAAPETVEADTPAAPEETPGATGEAAEDTATSEDARAESAESTAPEPAAEPVPEEAAAPEPEPENAVEVAAFEPQDTVPEPVTPAPEATPALPETVVPARKPPAPPRRTERAAVTRESDENFNPDRLSQLINRTDPSGGGSGAATASLGTDTGRAGAQLTLSEMDALRAQMQRCWTPPIGLRDASELVITVRLRLSPDGLVAGIDRLGTAGVGPIYDAAADAARRAVLQCQPYRLPAAKYDAWKEVEVNFDPRSLF